MTAEGLVGAAFAVVYGRLLRGEHELLTGLLGELMGMIVLPYRGPAAARREEARPLPVATSSVARVTYAAAGENGASGSGGGDPLAGVPMRLTYRTTLVLEVIAGRPGVSNRLVADLAEISDQGQISKLLARLQRLGLVENTGPGHVKGEPNAWRLTELGEQITERLALNTDAQQGGRRETDRLPHRISWAGRATCGVAGAEGGGTSR